MENSGKYGTGSIILAVLGGALVGATVALLVAPKSGRDTRRQLGGYYETAKDKVSRVPEALRSAGHAAKEAMAEAMTEEPAESKDLTAKRHGHA